MVEYYKSSDVPAGKSPSWRLLERAAEDITEQSECSRDDKTLVK